jgi:ABC-type polysaccharide/polyol phosphate transport system ATPase subunit
MTAAIRADHLSKRYRLGERETYGALRDSIARALAAPLRSLRTNGGPPRELEWIAALDDVSFEVAEGEIVGVIGRNGSGKSTLLKILSRITEPTSGRAEIRGRVGSLLEVGTGFHPELTGRENVFVNGAILGMSRREIARNFDEIVAFADLDRFIDTPVKFYSSGMQMRLAFAVAAHLEPDILLVDEVLAVGDQAFQKKCLGKMNAVAREGRTVLFVSHDLTAVQVLCGRALRLALGRVQGFGAVATEIAAYLADLKGSASGALDRPIPLEGHLRLTRFGFVPNPIPSGGAASFEVELETTVGTHIHELAVLIHDGLDRRVGVIDFRQPEGPFSMNGRDSLRLAARLRSLPLVEGEYRIGASIRSDDAHAIEYDLVTVDVTAPAGADFVPYQAAIRGVVAFDYDVQQS